MRIIASFASSLDGRTALPGHLTYVRISSDEDIRRLKALRDTVDAVLMGGTTFRAYPKPHTGLDSSKVPLHVIVTRGQDPLIDIPPDSPLFQTPDPVSVMIFTHQLPDVSVLSRYPASVEWMALPPHAWQSPRHFVARLCEILEKRGVASVLVEGGGEIMALFLKAQALQELYLTVCPLLIGDINTPGLVSGLNFGDTPPRTEILSLEQVENEIFLKLALTYPSFD